jgi:hypothetical protein
VKPWQRAASCPGCGDDFGTPIGIDDVCLLQCCACGLRWMERNMIHVAIAWYGYGANDAREALEK